jgi:poly(beta-D-mannuronate) lyase
MTPRVKSVGDVVAFRDDPLSPAVNRRTSNWATVEYNPPTTEIDLERVSPYGFSNRVDHCFFSGKQDAGAPLAVWLPSAIGPDSSKPKLHRVEQFP